MDLECGTEIIMIGPKTGVTSGLFIGLISGTFIESGISYAYQNAIGVQWRPNARFSKGGDSGSVYYAVKESFHYPVGTYRGTVRYSILIQHSLGNRNK